MKEIGSFDNCDKISNGTFPVLLAKNEANAHVVEIFFTEGLHSAEVAFVLLNRKSRVWISIIAQSNVFDFSILRNKGVAQNKLNKT